MTETSKRIKETLDSVYVNRKQLNELCKDRLDFEFYSIYFRYAEVCDELAVYMARVDHIDPIEAHHKMNNRKLHFYQFLEQLTQAHIKEEEET